MEGRRRRRRGRSRRWVDAVESGYCHGMINFNVGCSVKCKCQGAVVWCRGHRERHAGLGLGSLFRKHERGAMSRAFESPYPPTYLVLLYLAIIFVEKATDSSGLICSTDGVCYLTNV